MQKGGNMQELLRKSNKIQSQKTLRDCRGSQRESAGSSGKVRLRLRRAAYLSPAGMACSRLMDALISPTCRSRASGAGTRIALYTERLEGGALWHVRSRSSRATGPVATASSSSWAHRTLGG